jgi:predicted ferric reductase
MSDRTKQLILVALIAATTVPFFFLIPIPEWGTGAAELRRAARYGASVAGYIGIASMVWGLLLGARAVSRLFFTDLTASLKVHRFLGKYGFLLILLHPILVAYSYRESWLYIFLPPSMETYEFFVSLGRLAFLILVGVWITSVLLRGKLAFRPWKYIHYTVYLALVVSLFHVPEVGSSLTERGVYLFWLLFCVATLAGMALRLSQFIGIGKVAYRVKRIVRIATDIYQLELLPKEKMLPVKLGQYVYIQHRLFGEEHPFTVLTNRNDDGLITIAFKVFGPFTKALSAISEDDVVMVDGPYGSFTAEIALQPTEAAVCIAGGIGITPFVQHVIQPGTAHYLIAANRTRDRAVFRAELRETLGNRFIELFSDEPDGTVLNPGEQIGFFTADVITSHIPNYQQKHYYICGPDPMMDAALRVLTELGVPKSQIHTESFSV